jgi:hypothetical protein
VNSRLLRGAALTLVVAGCAQRTAYVPRAVARGEVTLRYRESYSAWAGGHKVAQGLSWTGLSHYVGCVPEARQHAAAAESAGRAARSLSLLGNILGAAALGGLVGFIDRKHEWEWLGAGAGSAVVGVTFAGTSRLLRNRANGHAVDAINYYNDVVGAQGATCADPHVPPVVEAAPSAPPPADVPPPPPSRDELPPAPTDVPATPPDQPTAPLPKQE